MGGSQLIREEIDNKCECTDPTISRKCNPEQPPGTFGWSVIAHPRHGVYNWECFTEKYKKGWAGKAFAGYETNGHGCPSVVRSYADNLLYKKNDGKGVFGIELATSKFETGAYSASTINWDQYLFADAVNGLSYGYFYSDANSPTMKFNPIVYPDFNPKTPGTENETLDYGNHCVVGMIGSDNHSFWFRYTEDTTAIVCNQQYIPIPENEFEYRIVPPFDDTKYIKSKLYNVPYITACTFVYADQPYNQGEPGSNQRKFLKQFRACGKDNQGVTASIGGAWGTFALRNKGSGSWVKAGGKLDINFGESQQIEVQVASLGTYLGNMGNKTSEIKKITVYGCCGELDSNNNKVICPTGIGNMNYESDLYRKEIISYTFPDTIKITSLLPQIIPNLEFNQKHLALYDYVRVEIEYRHGSILDIVHLNGRVFCSPIIIRNSNNIE